MRQDQLVMHEGHDVSVVTDVQVKVSKNPSWINAGKLKATVGDGFSDNCRQTVFFSGMWSLPLFLQER